MTPERFFSTNVHDAAVDQKASDFGVPKEADGAINEVVNKEL